MSQRLALLQQHLGNNQQSHLQQARSRGTLDIEELKDVLFGASNFSTYVKPYIDFIDHNRDLFSHHTIESHSLSQQRQQAAKMLLSLRKLKKIDLINQPIGLVFLNYAIGMFDNGVCVKYLLHYFLYAKSILLYKSNSTHLEFYQKAISGEDIGCFSLTEFHHGSYSKGIQTLATYDRNTDEFVLTTQGTKGMKFWIGALAELSHVTVLWAQLIVDGDSKGPHPFILPIRCKKTHKVLPGITIRDCGPKKGLNYIDNGSLMLQDVRIPKAYLLGKYGFIDSHGNYQSPIKDWNARFGIHMSALSAGRGFLAMNTNSTCLNATTIALRYAFSRKQFQTADKNGQIPIIRYPLTQIRLIPEIATLIVQIASSRIIAMIYGTQKQLFNDQLFVAQMHAISAAIKARYSWNSLKAAQECRTILGGHGYSAFSRIPSIINDLDVNVTWEGDNHMLLQQTSKYLLKVIPKNIKTKLIDLSFLQSSQVLDYNSIQQNIKDLNTIQSLIQDLLKGKYNLAKQVITQLKNHYNDPQIIDQHFHPRAGNSLSLCFADYFTFSTSKKIFSQAKNAQLSHFLSNCLRLWAFSLLEKERYGPHDFRSALQKQIVKLSSQLVDSSVVATDALTPSAFVMGSPFADYNGEGFKEYVNNLFSRKGTFERASYYEDIRASIYQWSDRK